MRILVFSHYYPPEVNAPAARTSEHCRIWSREGHEVTVVTCAPNHPSGEVYPGYCNCLFQSEWREGVRVIRIWTLLAPNEGVLRRSVSYASYLLAATLASPLLPRADVVVSTSPQFLCGLAGYVARLFKRTPWVLEVRDLWPDSIVAVSAMRRGIAVRLLEKLEAFAYRKADRIVAVSDGFVPHIAERCGDETKISVIKNGVDLDQFISSAGRDPQAGRDAKATFGLAGRFVAAYVGTHGMAHGLNVVLDVAERLRHDPRIAFLMVGDGAERAHLEEAKVARRLDNLVILGQRPRHEIPAIWQAVDASLVLLRRSETFKKVLPSKMFEAMAFGRPIVLGVEGEARELLERAGAGIAITPESAEELAAAVALLARNPDLRQRLGAQGAAYVRQHHDRRTLALTYLALLDEIARGFRRNHVHALR
jgi:glycosyltransferase involved in cell wall biosynthesis